MERERKHIEGKGRHDFVRSQIREALGELRNIYQKSFPVEKSIPELEGMVKVAEVKVKKEIIDVRERNVETKAAPKPKEPASASSSSDKQKDVADLKKEILKRSRAKKWDAAVPEWEHEEIEVPGGRLGV